MIVLFLTLLMTSVSKAADNLGVASLTWPIDKLCVMMLDKEYRKQRWNEIHFNIDGAVYIAKLTKEEKKK